MLARYGLLALVACTAFAQDTRLTNATIIEMTSAGTAPDAIVQKIVSAPAHVSPDYTQKKLASCTYLVNLSDKLQPGEYALLPPGPFASRTVAAGKIYSFRVAGTKN